MSKHPEWQAQRFCTDIEEYELIVEKQKRESQCSQKVESWKWIVSYHGSIVSSGTAPTYEQAQGAAETSVPAQ